MSLDIYENVKSIVEKETKLLNESGIITNEQKKEFEGQFISYDEQRNYIDVDPPPTSNEYSHSLYNKPINYLNKKLLNSPNGKIFIKTQNNLYLEYDDDGQLKLVNIENIENKDNIVWSFMGGNSDHMRFVSKDGAFLRANNNYNVSIPVLQAGKEDIKTGSNLWKILKKDDTYLLQSAFYKSYYLDHNLRISEGISEAKKWILEPVPVINTVTYVDITKSLMEEKKNNVDNYINLNKQIVANKMIINYLNMIKDKIDNIYDEFTSRKLKKQNNEVINPKIIDRKNISLLKTKKIDDIENTIFKIENMNKVIENQIKEIENNDVIKKFETKLEQMVYSYKNTLSNIQYDNNYVSGDIYKNLDNIENVENNLEYVNNKSLVLEDNYDIIKKNNLYLKRRRYFLLVIIVIFGIVLIGVSLSILNDIYKIMNYMN